MGLYDQSNGDRIRVWANTLTLGAVSNTRFNNGYANGERPPANEHNTLFNALGQALNHVLMTGVAQWLTSKAYLSSAVARHGGNLWIALANNTASTPTTSNANWTQVLTAQNLGTHYPFSIGQPPTFTNNTTVTLPAGFRTTASTGALIPVTAGALTCNLSNSGAGGLDTGSIEANTWYWLHLINGTSGTALLFSKSQSSPTMPGGYTLRRNLRTPWRTNGSSVLMPLMYDGIGSGVHVATYTRPEFNQLGASIATGANVVLSNGGATSFTTLTIAQAPPTTLQAHIAFAARSFITTVRPVDAPQYEMATFAPSGADNIHSTWIDVNASQQIQYKVTGSATTMICDGFRLAGV